MRFRMRKKKKKKRQKTTINPLGRHQPRKKYTAVPQYIQYVGLQRNSIACTVIVNLWRVKFHLFFFSREKKKERIEEEFFTVNERTLQTVDDSVEKKSNRS